MTQDFPRIKDIQRNRRRLIRPIRENGLLSYVLSDFWKILRYGRERHVIQWTFPFGLTLYPGIGQFLEKQLQHELAIPLNARLDIILRRAWKQLDKRDYNLLVMFAQFTKALENISFQKIEQHPRQSFEAIRRIQSEYTAFLVYPKLRQDLSSILRSLSDGPENWSVDMTEVLSKTEKLLSPLYPTPSLGDVILAVHMLKFRNYLELQDLGQTIDEPILSTWEYDVDEATHSDIYQYLDELDMQLAKMYGRYKQTMHQGFFFPRLDEHSPDLPMLQRFVTGLAGAERKGQYRDILANVPRFIVEFTDRWLKDYQTLLIGEVQITGVGSVQLFSMSDFGDYLEKIHGNFDQIERMRTHVPFFQLLRYFELTNRGNRSSASVETPSKTETSLLSLIDDHLRLFSSLVSVLSTRMSLLVEQGEIPAPEEEGGELEPALRYSNRLLSAPEQFKGKLLRRVLRDCIALVNLFLYELRDDELTSELEDESKLRRSISSVLEMARRIASRDQFNHLVKKYSLGQLVADEDSVEQNAEQESNVKVDEPGVE